MQTQAGHCRMHCDSSGYVVLSLTRTVEGRPVQNEDGRVTSASAASPADICTRSAIFSKDKPARYLPPTVRYLR